MLQSANENKLQFYQPHEKQKAFHAAGLEKRYRGFFAGNRVGKTLSGCAEDAMHATGLYPKWWKGKRFTKPTNGWIAAESWASLKDAILPLLLGSSNEIDFGTGLLPKHTIFDDKAEGTWRRNSNAAGALESIRVRHVSGGWSTITFKTYEQGREKFQSAKLDWAHLDEEPDEGIFSEVAMRLAGTGGVLMLTMTPLKGMSATCLKFIQATDEFGKHSWYTYASWEDNPHLTADEREALLAATEPHLREARSKGIPSVGSGRIYPVPESDILIEPFDFPKYFQHGWGLDVGWTNTALVLAAYDPNTDIVYLYDCYKQGQKTPAQHVADFPGIVRKLPGVCDPAADKAYSQVDGEKTFTQYRELLDIAKADNAVQSGLMTVLQRMKTGKLKVFNTPNMQPWLNEFRQYARDKDGKVVKSEDHLMDATRYFIVSGVDRIQGFVNRMKYSFKNRASWATC